jgi:microcystin-dependent protein
MWSGSVGTIPSGWNLCNGTNGTPDLQDRFVICAGGSYVVGATGGSADAVVVAHSHSITDPGHIHSFNTNDGQDGSGDQTPEIGTGVNRFTNSAFTGITIDSEGVSGVGQNLPPYYALAYIMKL